MTEPFHRRPTPSTLSPAALEAFVQGAETHDVPPPAAVYP